MKKNVTPLLLWTEYKQNNPNGYQYSRFCELYHEWCRSLQVSIRQTHRAGERLFVDYAGRKVPIVDPATGEITEASVFVAVLGASNYSYVEASLAQDLPSWITAHRRAFEFFGGVPQIVVPDNLKAGVKDPHRYEPDINPTYLEMALEFPKGEACL